jgi:hypothetical protein
MLAGAQKPSSRAFLPLQDEINHAIHAFEFPKTCCVPSSSSLPRKPAGASPDVEPELHLAGNLKLGELISSLLSRPSDLDLKDQINSLKRTGTRKSRPSRSFKIRRLKSLIRPNKYQRIRTRHVGSPCLVRISN